MSNAISPLDFDESALDAYYTKRDALTVLLDDTSACGGWGCVDGCADCDPMALVGILGEVARIACAACGQVGHEIQACSAIRALLFAEEAR